MTIRPIFLVAPLALALASCDQSPQAPAPAATPTSKVPQALVDQPSISGENALYHAAQIVSFGERTPGSPGYRQQLNYIKAALAKYGWASQEEAFRQKTPGGDLAFTNLRARSGKDASFDGNKKLILSCHIDTKFGIKDFTGANDGASGAALILELARVLSLEPKLAGQIELVFFDGEESVAPRMSENDGLYGSRFYANELKEPLPDYLINLDMVGRQGMKIRIPATTSQYMFTVYNSAVRELKLPKPSWGVAAGDIYDDHVPFAERGVSTLNIIDDFTDGNWWHTSRDSIDILSPSSFNDSGRLTLFVIRKLLE